MGLTCVQCRGKAVFMTQRAHTARDAIVRLAELFDTELVDVTFPGTDRRALDEAMRGHDDAEARVQAAEAACAEARAALEAQHASMVALMDRALAYLRVFAADRPELLVKLDAFTSKPRPKRGRRSKVATTGASGAEGKVAKAS